VVKSSQTRTFAYDELKRLLSAYNPESGTISYGYDANGNLTGKTDALSRSTSYVYDALNRLKSKTNSDGVTPNVTYAYDSASYGKGRLSSVSSSVSATSYPSYDAMGRVLSNSQQTNGQTYNLGYQYNLAGLMTQETYPSGRAVATAYNTAGRASSVIGTGQRVYVGSANYASHGALSMLSKEH
jgi:YD repeat-containing protein